MQKFSYKKVVIWGYPLYSHTASYGWEAYYKAFKHLGFDVHWFHDDDFPLDFDFSNTLFIAEGFADKNIPLNDTSCYFIWYCPSPLKYISAGVKKYIDVRMPVVDHKDHVHNYSFNLNNCAKVEPSCFIEKLTSGVIRVKNDYVDYEISDFDKLYINWATNLLPHEISNDDVYLKRDEGKVYFLGTISPQGVCENASNFKGFINECVKNNIAFYHNDPWKNPVSTEELTKITKRSMLGIEIRGPEHVRTRMIPERIFKNVSFGHLGMTNSAAVYEELEGNCAFSEDTSQLFYECMKLKNNFSMISTSQKFVKENHTYVNRVKGIIQIANGEY